LVFYSWCQCLSLSDCFLLLSPVGEIKLGADDENPAYSNEVWFAMLFSCGMGIGLLFWGVSEPIWHYMWPPVGEAYTAATVHVCSHALCFLPLAFPPMGYLCGSCRFSAGKGIEGP